MDGAGGCYWWALAEIHGLGRCWWVLVGDVGAAPPIHIARNTRHSALPIHLVNITCMWTNRVWNIKTTVHKRPKRGTNYRGQTPQAARLRLVNQPTEEGSIS